MGFRVRLEGVLDTVEQAIELAVEQKLVAEFPGKDGLEKYAARLLLALGAPRFDGARALHDTLPQFLDGEPPGRGCQRACRAGLGGLCGRLRSLGGFRHPLAQRFDQATETIDRVHA